MPAELTPDQALTDLRAIIMRLTGLPPEAITAESHLMTSMVPPDSGLDSLGLDTLDVFDMVLEIEVHFGFTMSDEEADKLHTVQDCLNLILENAEMSHTAPTTT